MRRQDFSYQLPDELIAFQPAEKRSGSRLLYLDGPSGQMKDQQFLDLLDHLQAGDVMVFNDTKVIPARVFGCKASGGKVEILIERVIDTHRALAHIRASKSPKPNTHILLDNGVSIEVTGRREALFEIRSVQALLPLLDEVGHMPLPPYIDREDTLEDQSRYQTVYGRHEGAVAAPTAGLHFDDELLKAIKAKGVIITYITLHVGAGTFQPVRVDNITDHVMHSEIICLTESSSDIINAAKSEGRRVIAVGTTSVRCLESVAALKYQTANPQTAPNVDNRIMDSDETYHWVQPFQGETDIFITPGYRFTVVDALITNFHLSESTLMMLVSAFAGYQHTMEAYRHAVAQQYRFFSYGDAMFITHNLEAAEQAL